MYQAFALAFLLAAILNFINFKWLKLPSSIGNMILALVAALILIASQDIIPDVYNYTCALILEIDFSVLLLDVMLSILLFAGAMHVNLSLLKEEKWSVIAFATLGVIISTFLIGGILFLVAPLLSVELPLVVCLLFGALISPTDPIAVLSILEKSTISEKMKLKIEGESLFNDGIGVVVFTSIMMFMSSETGEVEGNIGAEVGHLLLVEVLGGLVFGLLAGWVIGKMINSVKSNPQQVIMLLLGFVLGGYSIAQLIGLSAPLTMVVSGLYLGNLINREDFIAHTREVTTEVWHILDESLNTILFVLIGLGIHLVTFEWNVFYLGLLCIVIAIVSRFISIALPFSLLKQDENLWKTTSILTWGGLRGGISIALALSLSNTEYGDQLLLLCFIVVVFSIIVQGLTISKLADKLY